MVISRRTPDYNFCGQKRRQQDILSGVVVVKPAVLIIGVRAAVSSAYKRRKHGHMLPTDV
jgi:hypothetical protein